MLIGDRKPMIITALWPLLLLVTYFHAICLENLQSASGISDICNNSKRIMSQDGLCPYDTHAANKIRIDVCTGHGI